ncbi:hypothetical protein F0562_017872 [Nyssa sinensis]|uniref:Thioester reductase (TE) domain-containing protein n=1 Tax=Nyssa sinensis TaxID=561372 RepID=A0A5J4ZJ08_9ASTE|nr:hypothetical protein F0562_017872 [Nyssa sinensis]
MLFIRHDCFMECPMRTLMCRKTRASPAYGVGDKRYKINAEIYARHELMKASERLVKVLSEADIHLLVYGCADVFHTASPFYHAVIDPEVESIDPTVKGTLNFLGSCAKSASVNRVVLTSSVIAVTYNGRPRTSDVVVDKTWFSDPEVYEASKMWYVLSKTLAEDAAWKFAKEKGINMAVINPAMVIGPLLQPTLNTSAAAILNLINGAQTYANASFGWVNVKGVANAHSST